MISIITTLYNYKKYLPALAISVMEQTYEDWEWIIVDDASTDKPQDMLKVYGSHPQITVITLPKNMGYSFAKNIGLQRAAGDYFVMIDADDYLTKDSLQVRYDELQRQPDKLWVHAEAQNLNLNGDLEDTYIKWNNSLRKKMIDTGIDLTKEYHHRLIHAQTVMVRREFHKQLGLYDEHLRFSSDNEMWRRALRFGFIPAYIPTPVSVYRVHDKRMSRSKFKRMHVAGVKEYIKRAVEIRHTKGININTTVLLKD